MKNVEVIYPGEIFAPNGASTVVRLLYDYRSNFAKNGVNCIFNSTDIHNNELISSKPSKVSSKKTSTSLIGKLKKIIRNILYKLLPDGLLLDFIKIYLTFMLVAKRVVKRSCSQSNSISNGAVFIHDIFTCYYYLKYRKNDNRPILLVLHNNGETFKMLSYYYPRIKNSWVMRIFNKIENRVLKGIDELVFVSNNSARVFIENHPNFQKNRVNVVYNGIPDKPNINKRKETSKYEICCVASITDRKGQEIIVDALARLTSDKRSILHITFVGDGYLRSHLECKVKKLKIEDSVTFVGNQTNVDEFLEKSDIFILPSFDEGLPMSIIEAERAKLPIVSTKVAGIPEMIVHEQSGLLFNPNVHELTEIFENIDAYDWAKMGPYSYKIFKEKFRIENMINKYSILLNKLAK